MKKFFLLLFIPIQVAAQNFTTEELTRWENQATRVTIVRDNFGIPHIYGKTDADAVFGLLYAQCEDDFPRVEFNYIDKLGRLAEVNGKKDLYNDLLNRLMIDTADAKTDFEKAPGWLKKLLTAFADGVNYYLYKNPQVKPALLKRFYPWYPLLWTDGSIGAISTGGIAQYELIQLYGSHDDAVIAQKESVDKNADAMVTGSNGLAFAPSITKSGHAILYINPHVTFYFRPEVHMVSEEGLNAYGAVTWGQPFVYQGFNEHCGWMHTSSLADISDAYIENIKNENGQWLYQYDGEWKPAMQKIISIKVKTANGYDTKTFRALFTHHGPVMAKRNGHYITVRHDNRDMNGLIQSWLRTKAGSFADFKKTMDIGANPSNNTVYADAEGNIAYWHGNFMPRRDTNYDWSQPVDGTTSATEWKGFHPVNETVHLYNPPNGWLQNCNSTPFTVAGNNSPKRKDYPAYMAPDGENYRGLNAVRILSKAPKDFTIEKVIAAGYNKKLMAFEDLIPALVNHFKTYTQKASKGDSIVSILTKPINILRNWDFNCGESSISTTLAVEWGDRIRRDIYKSEGHDIVEKTKNYARHEAAQKMLSAFVETIRFLKNEYGTWKIPWGTINRFQRISGHIDNEFDDSQPSIPVGFASSAWGMLPSYSSRRFNGSKNRYGVNGNSFICAVEFGPTIKAKSLLAGGESGHSDSKHFFDQGKMFSEGKFKKVLFYKEDVEKHSVRKYHPGESFSLTK